MGTHQEKRRMEISGERIKELRKELNLTQDQLSDIIARERSEISKWEHGNGTISAETYVRLYDAFSELGASMDYIMGVKDIRKPQNESIVEELHLSEQAIENIRYEGSENGDNSRIMMLDLLLSDKDFFAGLMDDFRTRCYPPYFFFYLDSIPDKFLTKNKDAIIIQPENVSFVNDATPYKVYQKMEQKIDEFAKNVPDQTMSPNAFHPMEFFYYT